MATIALLLILAFLIGNSSAESVNFGYGYT
jgi:hypothetical protein